MLKLNYYCHIILNSKYNLNIKWVQILLVLVFYYICIKLHYFKNFDYSFIECMQRESSFEKDKEILTIAQDLRQKSNVNSTWNDIRSYFGYERIDNATITNPLKKAEFLERYAEFAQNVKKDQQATMEAYNKLSELNDEKDRTINLLQYTQNDQKYQIRELLKMNKQYQDDIVPLCKAISTKVNNLADCLEKKLESNITRDANAVTFSIDQYNSIKTDIAELKVMAGVTGETILDLKTQNEFNLELINVSVDNAESHLNHLSDLHLQMACLESTIQEIHISTLDRALALRDFS